jgi:DNA-binding transcriptional MerR regulator
MALRLSSVNGKAQLRTALARKPKKLWKVGDLIRHTGLTRQTLHNWCQLGLICEVEQTPGGHRLFDDAVFARIERIQRLKQRGKRLQEIAELLERERDRKAAEQSKEQGGQGGDH